MHDKKLGQFLHDPIRSFHFRMMGWVAFPISSPHHVRHVCQQDVEVCVIDLFCKQMILVGKGGNHVAYVLLKGLDVILIHYFAADAVVDSEFEVRREWIPVAEDVVALLKEKGIEATLVNARFAMPFDKDMINKLTDNHSLLVTMEENVLSGGFGEHVSAFVKGESLDIDVMTVGIPDAYVEHGSVSELKKLLGIDADTVAKRILEKING